MKLYSLHMPRIDQEKVKQNPFLCYPCKHDKTYSAIHELECAKDDYITFLFKLFSHSDYELALIANNDIMQSSISDLSEKSAQTIFELAYKYIQFLSYPSTRDKYNMKGGYPYIVYNYDEYTTDRGSGMSLKNFHLHLNFWKKNTIQRIKPIQIENIDKIHLKALIDPIFSFSKLLIDDILTQQKYYEYLEEGENMGIGYAKVYHIKNGWKFMSTPLFSTMLVNIHYDLNQAYIDILEAFTGQTTPPCSGSRHTLLDELQINKNISKLLLSESTKNGLRYLSTLLKNINTEQISKLKKKERFLNSILSLRWLSYSVSFFSPAYLEDNNPYEDQPLYINIALRLFSKIGGASIMNFPEYEYVNIVRNNGDLSADDFDTRVQFLRDFLNSIKVHSSGSLF